MVATGINKGVSPWRGQQPFQVSFQCFGVTEWYFEEILLEGELKELL